MINYKERDFIYYVYVCPGHIKYFNSLAEAQDYAGYYGTVVKRINEEEK